METHQNACFVLHCFCYRICGKFDNVCNLSHEKLKKKKEQPLSCVLQKQSASCCLFLLQVIQIHCHLHIIGNLISYICSPKKIIKSMKVCNHLLRWSISDNSTFFGKLGKVTDLKLKPSGPYSDLSLSL